MEAAQPTAGAMSNTPGLREAQSKVEYKNRNARGGLACAELILGFICVGIGAAIIAIVGSGPFPYEETSRRYDYNRNRYYNVTTTYFINGFATGEGIWCGAWIIAAGALGIFAARAKASRCLIITNMAFNIVASLFAGTMAIISGFGAEAGAEVNSLTRTPHLLALYSVLGSLGVITMILHIVSAATCCMAMKWCNGESSQGCCGSSGEACNCCLPFPDNNGAVMYYHQSNAGGQPFVFFQQPHGNPQSLVSNPQQPLSGQQPGTYVQQPVGVGQPIVFAQQPARLGQPVHAPSGRQPVVHAQQPQTGGQPVAFVQQPASAGQAFTPAPTQPTPMSAQATSNLNSSAPAMQSARPEITQTRVPTTVTQQTPAQTPQNATSEHQQTLTFLSQEINEEDMAYGDNVPLV